MSRMCMHSYCSVEIQSGAQNVCTQQFHCESHVLFIVISKHETLVRGERLFSNQHKFASSACRGGPASWRCCGAFFVEVPSNLQEARARGYDQDHLITLRRFLCLYLIGPIFFYRFSTLCGNGLDHFANL